MSVQDSQRWIEHLARRRPFFASVTLFMVVAVRIRGEGVASGKGCIGITTSDSG
jgi:hypothetical protein